LRDKGVRLSIEESAQRNRLQIAVNGESRERIRCGVVQ